MNLLTMQWKKQGLYQSKESYRIKLSNMVNIKVLLKFNKKKEEPERQP